jgi:WD40 repeat protein
MAEDSSGARLIETLRGDQRRRWQDGDRVAAETYLRENPTLLAAADGALELIYNEVLLREERGEAPGLEEYVRRFPQFARQLEPLFEVHGALQSGSLAELPATLTLLPVVASRIAGTAAPPGLPDVAGYNVVRELGRGGMGVVYWAWQTGVNRLVALKMIKDAEFASESDRVRFRTEAEAVGRLHHQNIVPIFEVGEHRNQPFLTMEFVEGGTLAEKLAGTPQPARAAAQLLATLTDAMSYAHERGIIHRDLTPANVLLTAAGVPKIVDFGLAKILIGGTAMPTQTGAIVGTPSYMAPEQAAGKSREVGPAVDIYALGAILYELLTGRPPFHAETSLETLLQVRYSEPVPPRRLVPSVPLDLETICLKCLQKDPLRRYASAEALASELRRFLAGQPILARPVGKAERLRFWCRRNPTEAGLIAAVVTLLVIIAFGATLAAIGQHRSAETARRARDEAVAAQIAERIQRRETEELLERQYVAAAVRLIDVDDPYAALPWIVEGLRLVEGDPAREEMHRFRLASVLQNAPQFVHVWLHSGNVYCAVPSPDGERLVTASKDHTARIWDIASGRPLATLKHDAEVTCAVFSPDGTRVATASADRTARVWNAATGAAITECLLHQGAVVCVEFSPSGSQLVTASADHTARVWESATGRLLVTVSHEKGVRHAEFSSDGARFATASEDSTARVWDATNGHPVTKSLRNGYPVSQATFSRDGTRLVTAAYPAARVWDAATARLIATLNHVTTVMHVAFSPDGRLVLTASADNTAILWNAATGNQVLPPLKHGAAVRYACFSRDGRRLATASDDGVVQVWDAATGMLSAPPLRHGGPTNYLEFTSNDSRLITASQDETARVWKLDGTSPIILRQKGGPPAFDARESRMLGSLLSVSPIPAIGALVPNRSHAALVYDASFSPDGSKVATASWDRTAQIWDAVTAQPLLSRALYHAGELRRVTFSPDGQRVATASLDHTARVWDTATGHPLTGVLSHGDQVFEAKFSPGGDMVVTASLDHKARLWNSATGQLLRTLEHATPVLYAEFSPDGARVATACANGVAHIWDVASGQALFVLGQSLGGVSSTCRAAFSPDGRRVVTNIGSSAQVWAADSGMRVGVPMQHKVTVVGTQFAPDGRRVLTASADGTARVWDAITGHPRTPPMRHEGRVENAGFSPDGRRIITASMDGTARVWDASTGEPVTPSLWHGDNLWHAAFSPDGRRAITTGGPTALLWELPFDDRPVADLILLAQVLTGLELRPRGQFMPLEISRFRADWATLSSKYPRDFAK